MIDGTVASGFEPVRRAFEANFAEHGDVGAAVAVHRGGELVVDLWGGHRDAARTMPWERDTIVGVFSTTKGVAATCANLLIERGLLDPDAPIADYWPEFAAEGKAEIPVRWALSHRAGVAAIDAEVTLDDILGWDGVVAAVAGQAPNWEPGTAHGYHARTYGWIVGELVRRVTGRSLGTWFREEIGDPRRLRFWIGLPDDELGACADLIPAGGDNVMTMLDPASLLYRVMTGPSDLFVDGYDESWNEARMRRAEMPSSNGIGDARSLATLYAAIVGHAGPAILSNDTIAAASEVQATGDDCVLGIPMTFGLGYSLPPALAPGCGLRSFGHGGAGGSMAFADPDAELAFAYVMNQLVFTLEGDPRAAALVDAVYECVGP